MLPKRFRLKLICFQQNPNSYQRFSSPSLTFQIKNSVSRFPRFVVIVPKALDKRSFYRNLTKRIIIEGIRPILPKIKKPVDVLVKAKRILQRKERLLVRNEILRLFKEARLL